MNQIEKKYIILGSLCAFLVTLVVGYAAFQSILKIKGTTTISSNWDVRITGITSNVISGNPTNEEEPTYDNTNGLSASFKTNLEAPEDIMEYEITVKNQGSINARLDKITLTESKSEAIKFETSGLEEGDRLKTGESKVLKVRVEYLSGVALDKNNMSADLTVTLDYSQLNVNDEGIANPPFPTTDLREKVVTSGDGIYEDYTDENRYIYRGSNPDNYIEFNDELWRIIALEKDGALKIIKNDSIGYMAWDSTGYRTTGYCSLGSAPTYGCNAWIKGTFTYGQQSGQVDKDAEINTYLNSNYYNSLNLDSKNLIEKHIFNIGFITSNNTDLAAQITAEKSRTWSGNVGLISVSDYIKSNTNAVQCGNYNIYVSNNVVCQETNYLFNSYAYWTITPITGYSTSLHYIGTDGAIKNITARNAWIQVLPVVFLNSEFTLDGKGTKNNPYMIIS